MIINMWKSIEMSIYMAYLQSLPCDYVAKIMDQLIISRGLLVADMK